MGEHNLRQASHHCEHTDVSHHVQVGSDESKINDHFRPPRPCCAPFGNLNDSNHSSLLRLVVQSNSSSGGGGGLMMKMMVVVVMVVVVVVEVKEYRNMGVKRCPAFAVDVEI